MADEDTSRTTELEEAGKEAEGAAALEDSASTSDDTELLEDDKEEQRQKTREGQIKAAERAIADGLRSLDEYPEYIREAISKKESQEKSEEKKESSANPDEIKQQLKDELKYETLEEKFKTLPDASRERVKEKYQFFKSKGFMKGEALSEALEFVRADEADERRKALASNADTGKPGDAPDSSEQSLENYRNLSKEDRLKMLKKYTT